MKEYQGKSDALNFISLSAKGSDRLDVVERMWEAMNRRVVNLHARMIKRVNILKAHVAQLEKMNGQRATTIAYLKSDKRTLEYNLKEARIANERLQQDNEVLAARVGRREQVIRNKAEYIDTQRDEIVALHEQTEELKKQNGDLQNDVTVMNERYEAIEMEMAEVLQRAD